MLPSTQLLRTPAFNSAISPSLTSIYYRLIHCERRIRRSDIGQRWESNLDRIHAKRLRSQLDLQPWMHNVHGHETYRMLPLGSDGVSRHARSISSWRRSNNACSGKKRTTDFWEDDWYGRWERDKLKQYEEFVKQVEKDPYSALFGASNKWLGWLHGRSSSGGATPRSGCESSIGDDPSAKDMPYGNTSQDSNEIKHPPKPTMNDKFSSSSSVAEDNGYDIDPITLRKIPKSSLSSTSSFPSSPPKEEEHAVQVKVKKFRAPNADKKSASSSIPSSQADEPASYSSLDWLTREGFRRRKVLITVDSDQTSSVNVKPNSGPRLESALDRHLQSTPPDAVACRRPKIDSTASRSETLVDATSNRSPEPTAQADERQIAKRTASKRERQETLDKSFDELSIELERKLAKEITTSQRQQNATTVAQTLDNESNLSRAPSSLDPVSSPAVGQPLQGDDDLGSALTHPQNSAMTSSHVSSIRAKLVPLKSKIDSLTEDYSALRKRLLEEKRRIEQNQKRKLERRAEALLEEEIKAQKDAMQTMEIERSTGLTENTTSIPASNGGIQGEGDMASNVHEFAGRARWYKRKAPHAKCEMNARLRKLSNEKAFVREIRNIYEGTYGTIDTKHRQPKQTISRTGASGDGQQFAYDTTKVLSDAEGSPIRAKAPFPTKMARLESYLIGKIGKSSVSDELRRDLEEISKELDMIQKDHKLPKLGVECLASVRRVISRIHGWTRNSDTKKISTAPSRASPTQEPCDYRILAYDNSAQKVTTAKIESHEARGIAGHSVEQSISHPQALNKVRNPGKFLPCLMALHTKGYDVVSVGKDVLVLKKVREATSGQSEPQRRPNPIDGTTTPEVSAGNFASPTGYVNYGPTMPPEERKQRPMPSQGSTEKVRRLEDVFSGTSSQERQENRRLARKARRRARRRQTLKRMLLTGGITAATCYGIGMVVEMTQM